MSFLHKMRRQKLLSFTMILFTLAVGIVIGTLINTGVKAAKEQSVAPGAAPLVIPNPVQLSTAFTQLAKQLEPSVVNVSTSYVQKAPAHARNRRRPGPDEEDGGGEDGMDFFQRFFGPFGGFPGGPPDAGPRRGAGLGSGVVIDRNGYILTNNHVVDKADRVQVKFAHDFTVYEAKVIGTDQDTDLAVIKISSSKALTPVRIGNSDAVNVGEWAVAIGSPFGFQATVTAGIISAKERDIPGESSSFQHFLQTDAAINPGNSGGPLLNISGEVIGINTAIATRSGGYQGIGFALPINTAAKVYNQIIKTGKVTRGSIGIEFRQEDNSGDLLRAYGATQGVFVQKVAPGGPAEKAGLKAEDIITAIDGKPVRDGQDLINRVADTPVGHTATITILRDRKQQDLRITIGDRRQVFANRYGGNPSEEPERPEGTQAKFGITIGNLTEQQRQSLNFTEKGGVVVTQVEPNSFSDDIGLAKNDVILSINRQPVTSVDDVKRIQGTLKPGDAVAFRIMRFGGARNQEWTSLFLAGTLPNTQ